MTAPRMFFLMVSATVLVCASCSTRRGDLVQRLDDADPGHRIRAVVEAAETGRTDLLPRLVDRLEDEDSAVRFYAILALEKLTGSRLGYSYTAPRAERRKAVQAWREHLAEPGARVAG